MVSPRRSGDASRTPSARSADANGSHLVHRHGHDLARLDHAAFERRRLLGTPVLR
jgi:hypothetical protein